MTWLFEPLGGHHDRTGFRCASLPLNVYLQQFARKDAERHAAAVFVMVDAAVPTKIIGYYALSAFTVEVADLPEFQRKRLPRYPRLPATLLGRLARDERHPGAGAFLLMDALRRAYQQSGQIGSLAMVAEAKDDAALRFYRKFGFANLGNHANRVFLPMGTIGRLMKP